MIKLSQFLLDTEKNCEKKNIVLPSIIEKYHTIVRFMVVIVMFIVVITILGLLQPYCGYYHHIMVAGTISL